MATKRYVVKKSGEKYRSQPVAGANDLSNWSFIVGGGLLTLCGLRQRSLGGLAVALTGAALLYRGVTGRNPLDDLSAELTGAAQSPMDDVDEASMESFPASDPPAVSSAS